MRESLLWFLILFASTGAELPSKWKKCSKSAPNHNDCIKEQIQNALSSLKKGVPDLNISPLEPLHVKYFPLSVNPDFAITFFDATAAGLLDAEITDVQSDPWKTMNIRMNFDRVVYKFNYNATGVLFNIRILSTGKGMMTIGKGVREINMTFTEINVDGKTYLKVKNMSVEEIPKEFIVDYRPSGRNLQYRQFMNKIINDNWEELLAEQRRTGFKSVKPFYIGVVESILAKIPKEDFDEP